MKHSIVTTVLGVGGEEILSVKVSLPQKLASEFPFVPILILGF